MTRSKMLLAMAGLLGGIFGSTGLGCTADGGSVITGGGSDGAGNGSGGSGGGSLISSVGSGGGMTAFRGCTSDLQSVVDENGILIETCTPEQGCFEGECIVACDAAAQSRSSIGCEYNALTPPFLQNESASSTFHGSCFAVFLANTWGRPAQLTVRYAGQDLDVTSFARVPSGVGAATTYDPLPATGVPPGQVAVLFLAHNPGVNHPFGGSLECPVTPAVLADTAVHNSGRGGTFEITSDTPVTAYDILPYGGAPSFLPSASLLYPRTAWGTNYLTVAPHIDGGGSLWVTVVGVEDNTSIDIVSPNALPAGTNAPAIPANTVTTVSLNAGEALQYLGSDPTGAIFDGDKPFGMYTGNTYIGVSTATSPSGGGQDSAHQQVLHVGALGNNYVGGGVVTRLASLAPESVLYRIVGMVDGTTLNWDPAPPPNAPTTLAAGQSVEFESTTFFQVTSQDEDHPFAMSHYLGGAIDMDRNGCGPTGPIGGTDCNLGDEEWVVMVPPEQYLRRYAFFTDPTYAATNLVVTRKATSAGFAEVSIECLGNVTGWQPVGTNGEYEVAHVDLTRSFMGTVAACETSQHLAESDGPFGITVWGSDYYASYGYPAGGNAATINEVVIPPDVPQ